MTTEIELIEENIYPLIDEIVANLCSPEIATDRLMQLCKARGFFPKRLGIYNVLEEFIARHACENPDVWKGERLGNIRRGNWRLDISALPLNDVSEKKAVDKKATQEIETLDLALFTPRNMFTGPAPKVAWLINDLLPQDTTIALAADGGIGKTWFTLELGLRLAAGPLLAGNSFLGFPITHKALVIILTTEDSRDDLHRRLELLDPDFFFRHAAQDNLAIIPSLEAFQGGFSFLTVEGKKNKMTNEYLSLLTGMSGLHAKMFDMPMLFIVDTYSSTHHGDENQSQATNEWLKAVSKIKHYYPRSSILVTHHIRKMEMGQWIKGPEDFRNAIRGSSAFVNGMRAVWGIWEYFPDAETKGLVESGARYFNFSLVKSNLPIDWSSLGRSPFNDPTITLRRHANGYFLFDVAVHEMRGKAKADKKAIRLNLINGAVEPIMQVIASKAVQGQPLAKSTFDKSTCKVLLPEPCQNLSLKELKALVADLIKDGKIVEVGIKVNNNSATIFDLPDGPYSLGTKTVREA